MSPDTLAPPLSPSNTAATPIETVPQLSSDPRPAGNDQSPRRFSAWTRLCRGFLRCHRRPSNVALHLITTPLGLFGLYGLIAMLGPLPLITFTGFHAIVTMTLCPVSVGVVHAVAVSVIACAAHAIAPGYGLAFGTLIGGYLGQDISHWIAGEKTFQSTYQGERGWLAKFAEHTILLLPVLIVIAFRWKQSPLRMLVARKAVLKTKLTSDRQRSDFRSILNWVHRKQPVVTQSNHWWQHDLDGEAGDAFNRLSEEHQLVSMIRRFHGPGYVVKPVLGMNEIYVTGPPKKTSSDTVFYMGHVDGPWAVFPGARLYRCMLSLNQNLEVTTHFPMSGTEYSEPESHRLEHGDAVAFDFNRELHYITRQTNPDQTDSRINLKLHFVAYPKSMGWYGRLLDYLTTTYDIRARNLFLATINPDGAWAKVKAFWVLGWTKIFELAVKHVGWTNLAFIGVAAVASLIAGKFAVFLALTSFVHYAIYLGTYQERTPVSFGTFRRDAMLFKTLAIAQLFGLFAISFGGHWEALALVLAGFGLAGYATWVLGLNRTYFSAELGFDPPKRINKFPFGVIPHPMIVGAMLGIGAMALVPAMRQSYGWLIAGHLSGYAAVLIHEIVLTRWRFQREFAESAPGTPTSGSAAS